MWVLTLITVTYLEKCSSDLLYFSCSRFFSASQSTYDTWSQSYKIDLVLNIDQISFLYFLMVKYFSLDHNNHNKLN